MKLSRFRVCFCVSLFFLCTMLTPGLSAQTSSIFWMKVTDSVVPYKLSMEFGNNTNATYEIDTALGEMRWFGECFSLCARWQSIPGRAYSWGSLGLWEKDLRGFAGAAKKDTFSLSVAAYDSLEDLPTNSLRLRWPDSVYLGARCDSMYLEDPSHTFLPVKLNMFSVDSLELPGVFDPLGVNPNAPAVRLFIYKYGTHQPFLDEERDKDARLPSEFRLFQNYPNPFNPSTTIRYAVPQAGPVLLNVYNLSGQVVGTLAKEVKEAGEYSATWNGQKVSGGIYFCRLQAGRFVDVKKMVLIK